MCLRNVYVLYVAIFLGLFSGNVYPSEQDDNKLNPYNIVIDNTYAKYPKYRIDRLIEKISIYGSSVDESTATQAFSLLITNNTNIRVISPANIDSILKGKLFQFGSGLDPGDAKLLAQMLQVDHILIYDETIAKHEEYANGGQAYTEIKIKIIQTSNGEIIYQDMQRYGAFYPYTAEFIYPAMNQGDINALRALNFKQITFKLGFALGMTRSGIIFKGRTKTVAMVLLGSPAHKAGIESGDLITKVNGKSIDKIYDSESFQKEFKLKQGDKVSVEYLRDGRAKTAIIKFPKIPPYPVEKEKGTTEQPTPTKKKMWPL